MPASRKNRSEIPVLVSNVLPLTFNFSHKTTAVQYMQLTVAGKGEKLFPRQDSKKAVVQFWSSIYFFRHAPFWENIGRMEVA